MLHVPRDTWHVARGTWHVTHDMCYMTQVGYENSLKISASNYYGFEDDWKIFFWKVWFSYWMNQVINEKGCLENRPDYTKSVKN